MSAELHSLCDRWYQAWLAKDAAVVEQLATEDYLYIAPTGMFMDRQAILAVIRSPSYRLDACNRSEVVVRGVGASAAIVRHRCRAAGSYQGKAFNDDNRCVLVWEKDDVGQWRIVMEQCSFSGM